ncbi:MAG: hypothetical protein LUG12_03655, partial [Erysipelotrichaceae bacterium]|nr:hypothetical protein [Erysipelotrichaceae bacterium]
ANHFNYLNCLLDKITSELSLMDQFNLIGGTRISAFIIYTLIKAGLYKVIKSTSGRILIPKIISAEWKS